MDNYSQTGLPNMEDLRSAFYHDSCDKYDYLIAAGCGAMAGLIDIFLVGSPADSKLQCWTDAKVEKAVMAYARRKGWKPHSKNINNIESALSFLEKRFHVNYDQRHSTDVNYALQMGTQNHRMKSLAHSPSIVGLFFSILNQLTSTSSFLSDGQLITIQTESFELIGNNFISKLFCGIANWFGHIMSDVVGSSGASGRGSGIVIPFYELFQLCDVGQLQVDNTQKTLATIATMVFQKGYDARFGLTMALPVVICDLSIKLIWAIKHYFYHKRPLMECIPTKRHDDLRMMLIIGNGTLCVMDGADAAIRSDGNWVSFFLRMNIIAWFRFVMLVLREVCIRAGISFPLQKQLDAYIRINEALSLYLSQLERIDIERFRKETEEYNKLLVVLDAASTETDLHNLLRIEYNALGIPLPYEGSFNDFMNDRSSVLEFK